MSLKMVKTIFLVAALYDIVLGIAFGLLFKLIFTSFNAELPNHDGYIQLVALYIFTFGIGFYLIYRNPLQNRQLIIPGILMKFSYAIVVFGHVAFGSIPLAFILVTLAVLDLIFVPFFIAAYSALNKMATVKNIK